MEIEPHCVGLPGFIVGFHQYRSFSASAGVRNGPFCSTSMLAKPLPHI